MTIYNSWKLFKTKTLIFSVFAFSDSKMSSLLPYFLNSPHTPWEKNLDRAFRNQNRKFKKRNFFIFRSIKMKKTITAPFHFDKLFQVRKKSEFLIPQTFWKSPSVKLNFGNLTQLTIWLTKQISVYSENQNKGENEITKTNLSKKLAWKSRKTI